jgi:hypothetical protein
VENRGAGDSESGPAQDGGPGYESFAATLCLSTMLVAAGAMGRWQKLTGNVECNPAHKAEIRHAVRPNKGAEHKESGMVEHSKGPSIPHRPLSG